jgi:eukaryotic-like serine/threonine-protein kinase
MRRPWMRQRVTTERRELRPVQGEHKPSTVVIFALGVIAVMALIAVVTFLIAIKGRERTLVPEVEGLDLLEALPELQDRGLQYLVVPKFDMEIARNVVISQRPSSGSVVKQGRVVELSVSKGAVLDRVPNYIGYTLEGAEDSLRAIYASSYKPLLRIADPSYVHAAKPEGTIIEQEPPPDTPVSGVTELHFVVSLGPAGRTVTVGDYVGKDYGEAITELAEKSLPFVFTIDGTRKGAEGTVVAQSPKSGSQMPGDSLVQLWMKPPAFDKDEQVFDTFQYEVPKYAVRVPVRVELVSRDGSVLLLDMRYHPGGLLAVPYVAGKGDELVLWIDDREVARTPADRDKR